MKFFYATILLGALPLPGQEKDVLAPRQVQVVYETFSLPRGEAARSQRDALADSAFYTQLVAGVEKGKVRQEKLLVIRSLVGQESVVEHVSELIFPAEYGAPELPNAVGTGQSVPLYREVTKEKILPLSEDLEKGQKGDGWQEGTFPATPAAAAGATYLKLGDSVQVQANIGTAPGLIALKFEAVHNAPAGFDQWGQDLAKVVMPRFEQQKLQSNLSLKDGEPSLVGTVSPEPVQGADDAKEARVWFAFVTASMVKND